MSYLINLSILKHNRNYRLLFIGQSVSYIGTMVTSVALPYQIYHLTQSILYVGMLSLAQLLPLLVTALLGGVLADRHHRRTLLIVAEILLALGCSILTFNTLLTTPHVWLIFIVAFFMSAVTGLHRPAYECIKQQIVDKRDFSQASALSMFTFSFCMIAGPAIGGLIIAHLGLVTTYVVDIMSFLISLWTLILIRDISKPLPKEDESTFAALKEGFQYAISRQELLGTYFVDFIAMIFGMPMALFPAIAELHGGAQTLGLLYSAPAVGAVVISVFSGWTKHIKRHGTAISIAAGLWGVAIIFFGMAQNLAVALFFLALAGAFDAVSGIFRSIMWNETIPNAFRGRLAGIEMISYLSGPKLGDTEASLVAAVFGLTFSIVSGGVLCVVGVGVCYYLMPKFRRYRSVVEC